MTSGKGRQSTDVRVRCPGLLHPIKGASHVSVVWISGQSPEFHPDTDLSRLASDWHGEEFHAWARQAEGLPAGVVWTVEATITCQ